MVVKSCKRDKRVNLCAWLLRASFARLSRLFFGTADHADWMFEKIQRPSSIVLTAKNLYFYWRRIPKIAGLTAVVVEPVYGCNLRCKTCWGSMVDPAERPFLMDWDTFQRVMDHLPATVETVTFSMAGEPLLHENLGRMIDYACGKDVRVILATNGTLLTGECLEMVARSRLSVVNVSVETDPETAREVRGIDLVQVRENIRQLVARKPAGMEVKIALVAHEGNADKIPEVRRLWAGVVENIKVSPAFKFKADGNRRACMELWRGNVNVLTDGTVMPCCVSIFSGQPGALAVGNVKEQTIEEMVRGKAYWRLLELSIKGNAPGPCGLCAEFRSPAIPRRALKLTGKAR